MISGEFFLISRNKKGMSSTWEYATRAHVIQSNQDEAGPKSVLMRRKR